MFSASARAAHFRQLGKRRQLDVARIELLTRQRDRAAGHSSEIVHAASRLRLPFDGERDHVPALARTVTPLRPSRMAPITSGLPSLPGSAQSGQIAAMNTSP